jgi:hypothetical protein
MTWPMLQNGEIAEPELKEKWEEFISECGALGSEVRNIGYSLFKNPERVFVKAEVRRLGEDYGDVYWHGNLDEKDSWGGKFSDSEEEEKEIVCGGWGTGTYTRTIPRARPDSPFSDRGLDKVGWFEVVASSGSICIHQGMCFWDAQDQKTYSREQSAYYYSPTKPCTPLDAILRLPGPGALAYEWVGTQNPRWH